MRIVGGAYRGRPLATPEGSEVRPTSDKVRLAVFNVLGSRRAVVDAVVLDAFCGTGALGLEALSQGASFSLFCDVSPTSLALARENANKLGVMDQVGFVRGDSSCLSPRSEGVRPVNLVFLDPPYRKNLIEPTVLALKRGNWLDKTAIFVIETEKEAVFTPEIGEIFAEKAYGETKVTFTRL